MLYFQKITKCAKNWNIIHFLLLSQFLGVILGVTFESTPKPIILFQIYDILTAKDLKLSVQTLKIDRIVNLSLVFCVNNKTFCYLCTHQTHSV